MGDVRLLTLEEVAKILRLGTKTIYTMAKNNEIPVIKIASQWRFEERKIQEWIDSRYEIAAATPKGTPRVLLVDDDDELLKVMAMQMKNLSNNIEVKTAVCGIDGLVTVGKFRPHVLVLDLAMPGVDGIEVCRRLKKDPETAGIYILCITGYNDKYIKRDVLAAGADMFAEKPGNINEAFEIVAKKAEELSMQDRGA